MMTLSDWRQGVDLTNDSDDDDDGPLRSLPVATGPAVRAPLPARASVPLPISTRALYPTTPLAQPTVNHKPLPAKVSVTDKQTPRNGIIPTTTSNRSPPTTGSASMGRNGAVPWADVLVPRNTQDSGNGLGSRERAAKRMKVGAPPLREPDQIRAIYKGDKRTNIVPSVQYMNSALKTNRATVPFTKDMPTANPRPLEIGRIPQQIQSTGPFNQGSTTSLGRHDAHSKLDRVKYGPIPRDKTRPNRTNSREVAKEGPLQRHPAKLTSNPTRVPREPFPLKPNYFSGPFASPREDETDSIMSDVSSKLETEQRPTDRVAITHQQPLSSLPVEKDHYLIFLKEVKQYKWNQITTEFNVDFPGYAYPTLQTHYSKHLNRRDRSQDPAVWTLPARFAAEAAVDWQTVRPHTVRPQAVRPQLYPQTTEQDYSSGADSAPLRERSHRAKRVNYTWPRNHRSRPGVEKADHEVLGDLSERGAPTRSETPSDKAAPVPDTAVAVDNEPMEMNYDADDAKFALIAHKGSSGSTQNLPYLNSSQRSAIHEAPADWEWDQLSSRHWQGSVLHVDFSLKELEVVRKAVLKGARSSQRLRHSTIRKQMRTLLADLTEAKILQLAAKVRRHLPSRDTRSITAFLQDAMAGRIADVPHIKRLTAAKPQDYMSTAQKMSTFGMLRQRELGQHSRRGWNTASRPLTYQVKNKYLDTLGPTFSWTGASSDVHTVAWSPDGECFAAGAVAVDDPDSMQYNRPNNLLYGNTSDGLIHELGEHTRKREKTQSGANSTHAMFVSQDPKLYTTVSSVAFATSGRLMYSAGYDETVCVWHTETESEQPIPGAKFRFKAQIDMIAVNRNHNGVLATAAKVTDSKAIRLLTFDEEDPSVFTKHNFHSSKAVSRSDWKILPSALQFEPKYGSLLLAGFGANNRDRGFDMTGDLCLWDVETQSQLHVHGSNKNVFDVEFNPNRSYMPLFAVGCVAGANVNRGTRSIVRLYDEKMDKYWCPLEIECKALDMNDVVWCPHDEHLVAAGCTNGSAYVWDLRWATDPLRVLSHGRPLMPLQDDIPHEITDTGIRFLSWGENATRLFSGSSDGVVKVWDVTRSEENTFIKDLITVDSGIMSGAFSPDMSKLIVGEVDGSITVLEVGRDDYLIKDVENIKDAETSRYRKDIKVAEKLRFVPYNDDEPDEDSVTGEPLAAVEAASGVAEGTHLLQTGQVRYAPLGGLPIRQVVQGPDYIGPFDSSVDAPFLRQQALEFQLSMATRPGPQCNITACKDGVAKVTYEEIGDSGRSADRIPDELRLQWKAVDSHRRIVPGKSKCTYCSRPARPSATSDLDAPVLCERCSFACFRCGAVNPIAAATTTLFCDSCAGVWDIGALGYECIQQPELVSASGDVPVPLLKKFGKEAYLERLEDMDTTFGDEMNALTDYYHSLAIDRPESPPL